MDFYILHLGQTLVSDLSPLAGATINTLNIDYTPTANLEPLKFCKKINVIGAKRTKVTAAGVLEIQQTFPQCKVIWDGPVTTVAAQPTQSWNTPAFQQWLSATQAACRAADRGRVEKANGVESGV